MKTTIDIADPILREARKLASRGRDDFAGTCRAGTAQVISGRKQRSPSPAPGHLGGRGTAPGTPSRKLGRIRDLSYEKDDE